MATMGWRDIGRVLACCTLTGAFFWCFMVLGFLDGGSAEFVAVRLSVGLVLSPVFAYLAVYKRRIALDYAVALVITVALLVVEGIALSFGGPSGTLSSPSVFWPCLVANFAFAVWWTRGRPRRSHVRPVPAEREGTGDEGSRWSRRRRSSPTG